MAAAILLVEIGIAATIGLVHQIGVETVLAQPMDTPDLVQGVSEVDERQEQQRRHRQVHTEGGWQ